jgi:hypothetical protein
MVNIYSVCPVQFLDISHASVPGYCPAAAPANVMLALPKCTASEGEVSSLGRIHYFNTTKSAISSKIYLLYKNLKLYYSLI